MATFYTADPHFGHANIIKYCDRPFNSVAHMNAELVARWNLTVGPKDTVWCLGDLALGRIDETLPLTAGLNGRKLLVPGNHDRVSSLKRYDRMRDDFRTEYENAGWTILDDVVRHEIGGREVVISHYPYVGDSHKKDRFKAIRPVDEGLPIIHGHVHEKWVASGYQYNVGVDVHDFHPVPEEQIVDWLESMD